LFYDYEMWLRLAIRFPIGYLRVRDCSVRIHDVRVTFSSHRYGGSYLEIIDYADEVIARGLPTVEIPTRVRHRKRARAHLTIALDEVEEGRRRSAVQHLARAIRIRPASLFDARFAGCLGALVLGRAGPRALGKARRFVLRRGLSLHRFR